jgi:hypothetical protein
MKSDSDAFLFAIAYAKLQIMGALTAGLLTASRVLGATRSSRQARLHGGFR